MSHHYIIYLKIKKKVIADITFSYGTFINIYSKEAFLGESIVET